jgi:hypothetical protein
MKKFDTTVSGYRLNQAEYDIYRFQLTLILSADVHIQEILLA